MIELQDRIELAQSMLKASGECFITIPEVFDDDGTVYDYKLLWNVSKEICAGFAKGQLCAHFDGTTMNIRKVRFWDIKHRWAQHHV